MKTNYKVLIIFLNFILLSSHAQIMGYRKYSDKTLGVSIDYPMTWELQQNPRAAFIFMRPLEKGMIFRENINLIISPGKSLSLNEYVADCKAQFIAQLPYYKEISTSYKEYDGNKYAIIIYEHKTNDLPLKVIYYLTLKSGKAYSLTGSSIVANFNVFYPMFDSMARSFKIF